MKNNYIVLIQDNEWQTVSRRNVASTSPKSALKSILDQDDNVSDILQSLQTGKICGRNGTWMTTDLDDTRTFIVIKV